MNQESIMIQGPAGDLEAIAHIPLHSSDPRFGIICHPHPLHEGTMHNKVVTTVIRAFIKMGMPCVRFNFRGVGRSAGEFGDIAGEVEDCLAVVQWANQRWPECSCWLAGFSFGGYVAAEVASRINPEQLMTIAPSIENMPYESLKPITCPWLVIQGEVDEVVSAGAVYRWFEQLQADKTLIRMPETSHFFHQKLIDLQKHIEGHYGQ